MDGRLRIGRDVTVRRGLDGEFVATSGEAATPGERFTLEPIGRGAAVGVSVVDSRPVLIGGVLRHRLRLKPIDGNTDRSDGSDAARPRSRRR